MNESSYIAVDLGATSGRVMLGIVGASGIRLEELHRFSTHTLQRPEGLHWDVARLYSEICSGVTEATKRGHSPRGIGFDTWGVDYGLINESGRLIAPPFHHRDSRTAGVLENLDPELLYRETGIQTQSINTLVQLLSEPSERLEQARSLLFMPDLFGYLFTGVQASERTIASTSQLLNLDGSPSQRILDRYQLPSILLPTTQPGSLLGPVRSQVRSNTGFTGVVLSVAGHDTASAIAALPTQDADVAFISCGTWGLVGFELTEPVLTEESRLAGFTNEHGVNGTYRFLRNVTGLWLLTECLRSWDETATTAASSTLVEEANACPRYLSLIDPLDPVFIGPGDMPQRIRDYCARTAQPVPGTRAEIARCIIDSLALSFADAIESGARITGKEPKAIHIVGGGSQIRDLCDAVANLTGTMVIAGPAEATAMGNILMQARALGEIHSISEVRDAVAQATALRYHEPQDSPGLASVRSRFAELVRAS